MKNFLALLASCFSPASFLSRFLFQQGSGVRASITLVYIRKLHGLQVFVHIMKIARDNEL